MISIIIPVLNEAAGINSLIDDLYARNDAASFEVIVVDGAPDRSTLCALRHPAVIPVASAPGRAVQMNAGATRAKGAILLFLHADTLLPDGALPLIKRAFQDRACVAGAFNLKIDSPGIAYKIIAAVASLRSRLSRMPYGDQAIFIRQDYFEKLGGYAEARLMEDVELMRRIRKRGDRICILAAPVMTSPRRWEQEGIICCTIRNWIITGLYFLGVAPEVLARLYGNHDEVRNR